jgi:UDP-glucose 4-epimerase
LKLLVTGGAGFIGSNLANSLINTKHLDEKMSFRTNSASNHVIVNSVGSGCNEVIAFDDLSLGTISNLAKEVRFVKGSVMDYDLVLELTRDCDFIFHQAALSSSPMFLEDPRKGMNVNIIGFMNIMESARRNKVRKVIYASSSSLYNGLSIPYRECDNVSPKTFYESSFHCRETIARTYNIQYGIESTGLRYFSVYGPNERHKGRFANTVSQFIWDMVEKKKSPVIYGDGSQTRDFTFVEDVVQANLLAVSGKRNEQQESGFNIYNVGTGTQTSFNSVIEIINRQLGTDIQPNYVNNPIANYVQHTMADLSLARSELGYEPRWKNVDEGVSQLIKFLNTDLL